MAKKPLFSASSPTVAPPMGQTAAPPAVDNNSDKDLSFGTITGSLGEIGPEVGPVKVYTSVQFQGISSIFGGPVSPHLIVLEFPFLHHWTRRLENY